MKLSSSRTVASASRSRVVTVRAASIVETAKARGHTTFAAAVEKAGLTAALSDPSANFTVFVPNNAAFAAYDGTDPHTKGSIPLADTLMVRRSSLLCVGSVC